MSFFSVPGLGGGISKSDRSFNSKSTQTILNSSTVSMFQNCDSNFSNVVNITITGDDNIIDGLWVNQNIEWTTECIADFFNGREYYNEMESEMIDLANTGQRDFKLPLNLGSIPLPDWGVDTTVNTEQIQTAVNQFFSSFNQDCSTDVQNVMNFDVDGNLNTATDITVDQMANGMTTCYFSANNQEAVSNQMLATVDGSTQDSLSIWGWLIIAAIAIIILIIVIVIIVVIVRAVSGNKKKEEENEQYDQQYDGQSDAMNDYSQYNYDTGNNIYEGMGQKYGGYGDMEQNQGYAGSYA